MDEEGRVVDDTSVSFGSGSVSFPCLIASLCFSGFVFEAACPAMLLNLFKDFATMLQAVGRLAGHFCGEKFLANIGDCQTMVEWYLPVFMLQLLRGCYGGHVVACVIGHIAVDDRARICNDMLWRIL